MPLSRLADWYVLAELNALVQQTGLTQQQVAEAVGVSARTITNYVTGETRPKAGLALSYALACGASEKRAYFLSHIIKQLDSGKIISDLEERNIFIVERAEATYGEFWKWEPWYIPGPLQIERYHMDLLGDQTHRPTYNWQRKLRRQITVEGRRPAPTMRYLIGTSAFQPLAEWDWGSDQFRKLVEFDQMPNCEIRVLEGLHRGAEHAFDIFLPAGHAEAGPRFVYVEAFDQSRHIEDDVKFGLYHDQVKELWSHGNPIGRCLDDWVH
jgi:transcriptional regulator with XRE-family HTH domain